MNIEELQQKKKELETRLQDTCNEFTEATRIKIAAIGPIVRFHTDGRVAYTVTTRVVI